MLENKALRIKVKNIGYFDPKVKREKQIISIGKYIYYKDLYAFIIRLKELKERILKLKLFYIIIIYFRGLIL